MTLWNVKRVTTKGAKNGQKHGAKPDIIKTAQKKAKNQCGAKPDIFKIAEKIPFNTNEGIQRCMTFRSADVVKPLISMQKVVRTGKNYPLKYVENHRSTVTDMQFDDGGQVTIGGAQTGKTTLINGVTFQQPDCCQR